MYKTEPYRVQYLLCAVFVMSTTEVVVQNKHVNQNPKDVQRCDVTYRSTNLSNNWKVNTIIRVENIQRLPHSLHKLHKTQKMCKDNRSYYTKRYKTIATTTKCLRKNIDKFCGCVNENILWL